MNGFTKCYDQPYSSFTTSSNLSGCSDSPVLFVGAKKFSLESSFAIGAFGSSNILAETMHRTTAYYDQGGAYWYRYPSDSFGFAASSSVNLGNCDYGEVGDDCASRLCWILDIPAGGYRAGCITGLNADNTWRKVIYKGNAITSCFAGKIITIPSCIFCKVIVVFGQICFYTLVIYSCFIFPYWTPLLIVKNVMIILQHVNVIQLLHFKQMCYIFSFIPKKA